MKKVLIGCGVITLLCIVLVVGCFGVVIHKTNQFTKNIEAAAQEVQQLNVDFAFAEPGDKVMREDRFRDYLAVRKSLVERVRAVGVVRKIMDAVENDTQPDIGLGDALGAIGEIDSLIRDMVSIFREARMSPDEYGYHARMTLYAIVEAGEQGDSELAELWAKIQQGVREVNREIANNPNAEIKQYSVDANQIFEAAESGTIPERNVELVKRYRDEFIDNEQVTLIEMVIVTFAAGALYSGTAAAP